MSESKQNKTKSDDYNKKCEDEWRATIVTAFVAWLIMFISLAFLLYWYCLIYTQSNSRELYHCLTGFTLRIPDWSTWWAYWCIKLGSPIVSVILATAITVRWYKKTTKAQREKWHILQKASEPPFQPEQIPLQYSLKALMLLVVYVAIVFSAIQTFGIYSLPSVLGILGSIVGYKLTVFLKSNRIYYVGVAFLLGVISGLVIASSQCGLYMDNTREWIGFSTIFTFVVILVIAKQRLRKKRF
jgi:hypothetical protein